MAELVGVTCATCGKTKKVKKIVFDQNKTGHFFCNAQCHGQWSSIYKIRKNNPTWSSIEVECSFCGKKKWVSKSYYSTRTHFYCSAKCQASWRKLHWKGTDNPLYVEKVKVYCEWCGKEKRVIPYLLTVNDIFFCNKVCQGQYKSKYGSKENHGRWQGGKSFEPYPIEFDSRLKREIKTRDNYTCMKCGEKKGNKKLHVHHIDYDKENNTYVNLITLCNSCHSASNSNRDYWKDFFQNMTKERFPD